MNSNSFEKLASGLITGAWLLSTAALAFAGPVAHKPHAKMPSKRVSRSVAPNCGQSAPHPKVVLISLDGMTPRFVQQYLADGAFNANHGIGRIIAKGVSAQTSLTITPSLTAPGHIAIATGSSSAKNDVVSNTFHLLASPINNSISGFGAPIGGYSIDGPAESPSPTANPIWVQLRAAGKKVVTATWPGGDGVDVKVPGISGSPIIQSSARRTVDYTVPFGAFTGPSGAGYNDTAASYQAATSTVTNQLTSAGIAYAGTVQQRKSDITFTVNGKTFNISVLILASTTPGVYDTMVFFDKAVGIVNPSTVSKPSTGSAILKVDPTTHASAQNAKFYLEGSTNKTGLAFFVTNLAPDLSTIHFVNYSGYAILRGGLASGILANIDDINNNVGYWADQPDFRFPERINGGLSAFTDAELEAIYEDTVRTWVPYQTAVAVRAIQQNPDADLVMTYIEQPDGSFHQFLLTDPRQPTDPTNPNSILAGQDPAKKARYAQYLRNAYKAADDAVEAIIQAAGGVDANGKPVANVLLVSDHGFDIFHTAVNMSGFLTAQGFSNTQVRAYTSGPAAHIYINLQGRESGGTVTKAQYRTLQQQIVTALQSLVDTNTNYGNGSVAVFDKIYTRPLPADENDPTFGRSGSSVLAQDSGDVYALLAPGYNFDGTQSPAVTRLGDASSAVLSVPNFYGAHGFDPSLPNMSPVFYAAGPDIAPATLAQFRNIDVAPTISSLLGVAPASTVDGQIQTLGVGVTRGGFVYDRKAGRFTQQLTLKNSSTSAVAGPIHLILDSLSASATLTNATGVNAVASPTGRPYITVLNSGSLAPGASTTVTLQFTSTGNAAISYFSRVVAGSAP